MQQRLWMAGFVLLAFGMTVACGHQERAPEATALAPEEQAAAGDDTAVGYFGPGDGDAEGRELAEAEPAAGPAAEAPAPRPATPPRRRAMDSASASTGRFAGHRGGGGRAPAQGVGGLGLARPGGAVAPQRLPQSGVLASTFVAGSGVQARLDDLLDRGVLVDGERIRLAAFEDRAPLPYAVPRREAVALYANLERTQIRRDGERVHLQVALVGRQGEAPARPRVDLRLVLDRSGSMRGEKWRDALAAAHAMVDRLEPGDTLGLISYSDDATLDFAPRRLDRRGRAVRAAHAALNALSPGGGTNIGAALAVAQQHAPAAGAGSVKLVMLVSDGRATSGQTNAGMLGAQARAMFDARGVLTTSVGLGADFDEQTMLTIAREGSGSYHFVRRSADIASILDDELDARLQAVAQALRVRVELGDGVVARQVYGSRMLSEREHQAVRATEVATDQRLARELGISRTRQREEERGLRIHLPTFRRGDQHVVLFELEVPAGTDPAEIARVTLDYKDLRTRENRTTRVEVRAERAADDEVAQASTERIVKRTVLAFQAGQALQAAATALGVGDIDTALTSIRERRRLLEAAAGLWRDQSLAADAQLLARYERVLSGAWGSTDPRTRTQLAMAMNYFGDERMR